MNQDAQETYATYDPATKGTGDPRNELQNGGCYPAFYDPETRTVMLSRFANGATAAVHVTDGLPEDWIIRGDATGAVARIKDSIIAGFLSNGHFYTREEASGTVGNEDHLSDLPARFLRELFSGLNREELVYLSERMTIRSFPKNTVILSEDEPAHALYVITDGRVKITKVDTEGKEVIIAMLSRGDYFGEAGLIDNEVWPGNVIAKEKCEIRVFRKNDLHPILMRNPQLAMSIVKGLINRLRDAYVKIASLALKDVYGRIVQLLLDLASESAEGHRIIDEPLTQQEIASMIGSSREMVSRIIGELVKGGYISIDNKRITILKSLPPGW